MPTLQWSDGLVLDLPEMDDTHHEFVDLLAAAESASDEGLPAAWSALVDHTDDHFAREDRWMHDTAFSSGNCHSVQHKVVLQVMREGELMASNGHLQPLRQMIRELAAWFPQHAQIMDAALALHLRRVGYDAATGVVSMPQALPQTPIHGCGGSCSGDDASSRTAHQAEDALPA